MDTVDISSDRPAREAGFKLYTPDGLQIYIKITSQASDADAHIASIFDYIARMQALGMTVSPPNETVGARIETVDAYVIGESKTGDACVYLYSAIHKLKFAIATVWVERFPELPFKPTGTVWPGTAPERDTAAAKRYLVDIPPLEIVLEPQFNPDGSPRLSKNGNPIYEFARVKGAMPVATLATAATETAAGAPTATATASVPANLLCPLCKTDWRFFNADCGHVMPDGKSLPIYSRTSPLDPGKLRIWLTINATKAAAAKRTLLPEQHAELQSTLDALTDAKPAATLTALTNHFRLEDVPEPLLCALHDWLCDNTATGRKRVSVEIERVLAAVAANENKQK